MPAFGSYNKGAEEMSAKADNPMYSQEQVALIAREAAKAAANNLPQQLSPDNRIEKASSEAPENRKEFSGMSSNGNQRLQSSFSQGVL